MIKTKGYAAASAKAPLGPYAFERREPREHDVAIDIKFCGICHSDIHQAREEWGEAIFPMVPGHEIAGIVTAVGSQVTKYKVGDKVGVGCFVDSCRTCAQCQHGFEHFCVKTPVFTYNSREKDGTPTMGGYSDKIVVDENYVLRMPDELVFRRLRAAALRGNHALLASEALEGGARQESGDRRPGRPRSYGREDRARLGRRGHGAQPVAPQAADGKRLGADHFYATSDPDTFKKLHDSFDLIINTVSSPMDWNQYIGLLKIDGSFVVVGIPEKPVPVAAFSLIHGRHSVSGSMIGGIPETQEMLDFCAQHQVACDIELIPIQNVNEAYDRVVKSDVRYRFVIDMASLK